MGIKELILVNEFIEDIRIVDSVVDENKDKWQGYEVKTNEAVYTVQIDAELQCCESFGYITSEDPIDFFIGSQLVDVVYHVGREIKRAKGRVKEMLQNANDDHTLSDDSLDINFVDFVTNRGTFQLAVYNFHNGYYGHPVKIKRNNEFIAYE